MNLFAIGCRTLWREFSFAASQSPHQVRLELLHPEQVADGAVQDLLDDLDVGYDAVVMAIGSCALPLRVPAGLDCPVVMPRIHDCAGLLLGSKERHRDVFEHFEGACHWDLGGGTCERLNPPRVRPEVLINLGNPVAGMPRVSCAAADLARGAGIAYREFHPDLSLVHSLFSGHWCEDDCMVIRPGETALPSFDAGIVSARASLGTK